MTKVCGYKVFNPDFTCQDFQFEIGKTYEHDGEVKLFKSGFHFCEKLSDCFSYYHFNPENIVCEVECEGVNGDKDEGCSKRVCRKITIIRQLTWHEVLDKVNTGYYNSGYNNSGDYNSGDYNSCINGKNLLFCTENPNVILFNKPTNLKWYEVNIPSIKLVFEKTMEDGCVKNYSYKEAWKNAWEELSQYNKDVFLNLPNFDKDIFFEITGVVI